MTNNKITRTILGGLLLLYLFLSFSSIRYKSLTTDEEYHLYYGDRILELKSGRYGDNSKMPLSVLNALATKIIPFIIPDRIDSEHFKYQVARLATILFSLLVAHIVFRWSSELYCSKAGLFSLFLFIFDPNLMAHGQLITTDMYSYGTALFTFYFLWKFNQRRDLKNGVLAAIFFGISQIAKYSNLLLFLITPLIFLYIDHNKIITFLKTRNWPRLRKYLCKATFTSIGFILITLIIINIGFLFHQSFTPFGEYEFYSDFFIDIQNNFSFLNNFPVPTPYPYLQGIDYTIFDERSGASFGRAYLLGELKPPGKAFIGYYLVAAIFKTPIAIMLIVGITFYQYTKNRERSFSNDELFLLLPVIIFALYLNLFNQAQTGIRYFLIINPFLYIFSGYLIRTLDKKKIIMITSLSIYLISSNLSYYPHYLSYFNELVWDRKTNYRYLSDSNIDWGQSEYYLKDFLEEHPHAKFNPEKPTSGLIIVEVKRLTGITGKEQYKWVLDHFEPVDQIAYTYPVFNIRSEELDKIINSDSN